MQVYVADGVERDVEAQFNALRWRAWRWGFVWGVIAAFATVVAGELVTRALP